MTAASIEGTVAALRDRFPPGECLVRILAPVGFTQQLFVRLNPMTWSPLYPFVEATGMTPTLYGVPIIEREEMPSGSPPLGEFADGSIRPFVAREEDSPR